MESYSSCSLKVLFCVKSLLKSCVLRNGPLYPMQAFFAGQVGIQILSFVQFLTAHCLSQWPVVDHAISGSKAYGELKCVCSRPCCAVSPSHSDPISVCCHHHHQITPFLENTHYAWSSAIPVSARVVKEQNLLQSLATPFDLHKLQFVCLNPQLHSFWGVSLTFSLSCHDKRVTDKTCCRATQCKPQPPSWLTLLPF